MQIIRKLFQTKASSLDDSSKSVTFVISTNEKDRYGDVVDQKSWDLKSYLTNPILLWGHNPDEPENVLGTASDLQIAGDGSQTTAVLTFATDINPKAAMVYDLIKRGVLRTVSVGFRNHTLEYDDDTPVLKDNELLEISVVPIPANAGALAKELKAGNLHARDAKWLLEGMRKEADLLDEQLRSTNSTKEKSMTDEQATQLIETVNGLKTALEEQGAKLDAQAATISEIQTKVNEAPAPEAKPKEGDQPAGDTPPAKGGEDDQPGAGADEIDLDTELTPEQEAQAREDLGLPAEEPEPAAA